MATVMKAAQELLGHPLALPVAVGIATVLFTVVLFFSLGQKGGKRPRKKSARASAAVGGTTTVDGVRRSTRRAGCCTGAPIGLAPTAGGA